MNEKEFEILGITRFHNAGYKGQRVKILSEEKIEEGYFDEVITPFGRDKKLNRPNHATVVMDYLTQVVPKSTRYSFPIHISGKGNEYYSEQIDYIKNNNIQVITSSSKSRSTNLSRLAIQELIDKDVFCCCSAGNSGSDGITGYAKDEEWISIGGVLYSDNGEYEKARYSSTGDELDFVTFAELENSWGGNSVGTSFCSPVFAGMVALVQDFFIDRTGKQLKYDKLLQFIKDNCIDLDNKGHDKKTGNGLFVLPNPSDIEIWRYADMKIEMQVESKIAILNGEEYLMDTTPIIQDSRTLVPLRFIAEALGMKVLYDNEEKKITIGGDKK